MTGPPSYRKSVKAFCDGVTPAMTILLISKGIGTYSGLFLYLTGM
jgi:hypothetical protein